MNVPEFIYASFVLSISRKLGIWLSLGGFHERGHDWGSDRRIYNSHVVIDKQGAVRHSQTLPRWLLLSPTVIALLLTFSFHSQVTLFQSTGRPICLMWSCRKKVFLWKKVPSQSLDHPSCLQSKLLLARSHFILSCQIYSSFILWKAMFKTFHQPSGSHLRHCQTIQVWSWLANKLTWVLASPTNYVLWMKILKVHWMA